MRVDVVVMGAGLAGLACARDLMAAGVDVVVLEARERTGGRVEGARLDDGRLVQVGGEVVGTVHLAYRQLAAELGLELVPSYTDVDGDSYYDLRDGVRRGESWLSAADLDGLDRLTTECARLARDVDPADPWSAPDAERLDRLSLHDLAVSLDVTRTGVRRLDLASRYTGMSTTHRYSVLAHLRATAAVGGHDPGDYSVWENLKVDGGSSVLVDALTEVVADRIRLGTPVHAVHVGSPCRVDLADGETIEADAVVCAVPNGPRHTIAITGLSDARLRSLQRQGSAAASKAVVGLHRAVWEDVGCNGQILSERETGGFWVQGGAVLSSLNGDELPDQLVAMPESEASRRLLGALERVVGPVGSPQVLWRHWGHDPWSLGYVADWSPGDLTDVGPLHGTHEPPFYVAGSDHWASGYMEGAVATGRHAAAEVVGDATAHPTYPASRFGQG